MSADAKKTVVNKFPLRLMPSVRRIAEDFSQKEGVSLNQFINVAVAEKLAHLQHDEWLARRSGVTGTSIAKALAILDRPTAHAPEEDDRLPKGYVTAKHKYAGKKTGGRARNKAT
jgi:hypothetical protein